MPWADLDQSHAAGAPRGARNGFVTVVKPAPEKGTGAESSTAPSFVAPEQVHMEEERDQTVTAAVGL